MNRLVQFTAAIVALLAINACEQHTTRDLATLEKEPEHEGGPGHGEQISATAHSQEIHAGAPAKDATRFFPKQ